jgi:predicted component of type VI protein secretion system
MTSSPRRARYSPPPWIVAALVLTLALAAVSGCSSRSALTPEQQAQADLTAYEQEIRKVIPDPARADQLIALTNEFQQLVNQSIASIKNYRARVATLNSNYDATRADYEALFSEQDAAREAFLKKAGALRERMTVFTSDAEWEQLKKVRLRALDADLQELLS